MKSLINLKKECATEFFAFQGEVSKYLNKFEELRSEVQEAAGDERLQYIGVSEWANLNKVLTNLIDDTRHTCVQKYDDIQEYFNGEIEFKDFN